MVGRTAVMILMAAKKLVSSCERARERVWGVCASSSIVPTTAGRGSQQGASVGRAGVLYRGQCTFAGAAQQDVDPAEGLQGFGDGGLTL